MSLINTAIILDGGSIPEHLDQNTPIILTEINGKTLLHRKLNQLQIAGIKNVVISTYAQGEVYDEFINKIKDQYEDLNLYVSKEKNSLGSGGAIKNTMLNINADIAMVLHGAFYIDTDLLEFIDFHNKNNCENSILLAKEKNPSRKLYFKTEDHKITSVSRDKKDYEWVDAGIYIIQQSLFNITHLQKFSLSDEILIQNKHQLFHAMTTESKLYNILNQSSHKEMITDLK